MCTRAVALLSLARSPCIGTPNSPKTAKPTADRQLTDPKAAVETYSHPEPEQNHEITVHVRWYSPRITHHRWGGCTGSWVCKANPPQAILIWLMKRNTL